MQCFPLINWSMAPCHSLFRQFHNNLKDLSLCFVHLLQQRYLSVQSVKPPQVNTEEAPTPLYATRAHTQAHTHGLIDERCLAFFHCT